MATAQPRGTTAPEWLKARRRAVGEALAALRKSLGLSQEGLASKAGITTMTLGRIERGDSGSEESYGKIAVALNLTPDWHVHPEMLQLATEVGHGLGMIETSLDSISRSEQVGPTMLRLFRRLGAICAESRDAGEVVAGYVLSGAPALDELVEHRPRRREDPR